MNWRRYWRNIIFSIDRLGNAFGGGDIDYTISARAGIKIDSRTWAYRLCRVLHWIDKDHCKDAADRKDYDHKPADPEGKLAPYLFGAWLLLIVILIWRVELWDLSLKLLQVLLEAVQ